MKTFLILAVMISNAFADDIIVNKNTGMDITPDFEIVNGTDEVAGEPSASVKDAYEKWKAECKDWKNEFKANNKDNIVIAMNCGAAKIDSTGVGLKMYKSLATYKIKTKVRNR